jgi:hypothetical protein
MHPGCIAASTTALIVTQLVVLAYAMGYPYLIVRTVGLGGWLCHAHSDCEPDLCCFSMWAVYAVAMLSQLIVAAMWWAATREMCGMRDCRGAFGVRGEGHEPRCPCGMPALCYVVWFCLMFVVGMFSLTEQPSDGPPHVWLLGFANVLLVFSVLLCVLLYYAVIGCAENVLAYDESVAAAAAPRGMAWTALARSAYIDSDGKHMEGDA